MTIRASLEGQGQMGSLSGFFKAIFQRTSVPDGWKGVFRQLDLQKNKAARPVRGFIKSISIMQKNPKTLCIQTFKHRTKHVKNKLLPPKKFNLYKR